MLSDSVSLCKVAGVRGPGLASVLPTSSAALSSPLLGAAQARGVPRKPHACFSVWDILARTLVCLLSPPHTSARLSSPAGSSLTTQPEAAAPAPNASLRPGFRGTRISGCSDCVSCLLVTPALSSVRSSRAGAWSVLSPSSPATKPGHSSKSVPQKAMSLCWDTAQR